MLRRSATVLAATSALVLTATAPAFADHGPEPDNTLLGDGFNATCSDVGLKSLNGKVDPPTDVDGSDSSYTATLSNNGVFLEVEAKDGFAIDAVLVKGGNGTNRFNGPNFTHLFSPDAGNSAEPAKISHYEVCGHEDDGKTPDPGKTESPDPDTTGSPDPNTTETPDHTSTPTPKPTEQGENADDDETSESPAPVPTAVPAGGSGSGDASMAPFGIAAAALMAMAGGAALLRRRFANQS